MATLSFSSGALNALRWGALAAGVYYGFSRDLSLHSFVKERAEAQKKTRYEQLVEEAKIAFETQHNIEQAILATAEGVASIDANSYKFDAEKWINFALAQSEKDAATAVAKK